MLSFRTFAIDVHKLFPLTISRGTSGTTRNLFVEVSDGVHTGIGEGAPPTGTPEGYVDAASHHLAPLFEVAHSVSRSEIWARGRTLGIEDIALAALDCALWDLEAKQKGVPLHQLLGSPKPISPTTVTIGIEPEEVVRDRVPRIIEIAGAKALKVKLGSPAGRDHDQAIWSAAREASAKYGVKMRADANGGWNESESIEMAAWLAARDCEYIEQPVVKGNEAVLPGLLRHIVLPVFLDESIRVAEDVSRFHDCCHGVNLKLMKSGGLTEGLEVLDRARTFGLKTMIGCMCETAVGIAQSAAISGICDYIDLDTHFNHDPEPGDGVDMIDGVVTPRDVPGHGGFLRPEFLP
jgi:muconate cycloisomerase